MKAGNLIKDKSPGCTGCTEAVWGQKETPEGLASAADPGAEALPAAAPPSASGPHSFLPSLPPFCLTTNPLLLSAAAAPRVSLATGFTGPDNRDTMLA